MPPSSGRAGATRAPWLTVIGIGEDGVDGLGRRARDRIATAEAVFGGRRHLALAAPLVTGAAVPWPVPFDVAPVLAHEGRRVCVLASGDPFLHGVGGTLAARVGTEAMEVIPAASSFGLAAARLGWPLQTVETIALHAQPTAALRPLLHPGARILALTADGAGPATIATLLAGDGFGPSVVHVLEALGGPAERHRAARADAFALDPGALNLVAIEVVASPEARPLPLTPGLPEDRFEHDGQITRPELRALALAALAPRRGELLWDVGAGAGSIAVEWMLRHPSLRAVAVEAHPERAARIGRNATALGVPALAIVAGHAPDALAGLPPPDAIFVGGGGTGAGVLDAAVTALKPGGRLVAHGVTLEMEARLAAAHAAYGGDLVRVAVERAEPLGGMTGWRPARTMTQWTWGRV